MIDDGFTDKIPWPKEPEMVETPLYGPVKSTTYWRSGAEMTKISDIAAILSGSMGPHSAARFITESLLGGSPHAAKVERAIIIWAERREEYIREIMRENDQSRY